MKTVPLGGIKAAGRVALVDDEDYDLVMQYQWHIREVQHSGARRPTGPYAVVVIQKDHKFYGFAMHQLITGWPQTDHINHNGLDNRRENLRPATTALNAANRRPHRGSSSRYKGVSWNRANRKWTAQIMVNRRQRSPGAFTSEDAAARAYDAAAREAWGEWAYTNFPD